jgi:uncharacterized protein DUF6152
MKRLMAIAVGLLIPSIPLFAHHGNSAFDSKNRTTLKGTVTEWYWANPHCTLKFDVKDDRGQVVHWITETSNPADMVNHGWNKLSLKPGDQVTITLEPAKNGLPIGRVLEVVAPNGQKLGGGFADVFGGGQGGSNAGATDASKSRDSPKQ